MPIHVEVGVMKSRKWVVAAGLVATGALVLGGFLIRNPLESESLCTLIDTELPSFTDEGEIREVVDGLRSRAEVLSKPFDVSDAQVRDALKTLADGFSRIADEVDQSGREWKLDEIVIELAKDPALTEANIALEGALQQCS